MHPEPAPGRLQTVLDAGTAASLRRVLLHSRAVLETHQIALKIIANFPDLPLDDIKACIVRAARSTHEYAKFARFHNHKEILLKEGGGIAVFGSARPSANDTNPIRREGYEMAREAGRIITKSRLPIDTDGNFGNDGLAVVSGGGPGYMLASCELANQKVWPHCILIPHENGRNKYAPPERSSMFLRFPFRKLALMDDMTRGVMIFPGGYGTIEEFAELLSLTASGTLPAKPVVLIGTDFYGPMLKQLKDAGIISRETANSTVVVNTPEQAMTHISGWYERNPEHKIYRPFRMLESYTGKSAAVLDSKEMADLKGMDSSKLDSWADEIAAFIQEEFRLLLSGEKLGEDGKPISTTNIWDQCDEPVMYGTYKWFTDRLFMECGLAQAGVDKFVLLFGNHDHPHFIENRDELLRRGHTIVSRLPATYRDYFSQKLYMNMQSGLLVHRPGQPEPLRIPTRYRLTTIDSATQEGRLKGILAATGSIATLHRLAESLCWKQTHKLPPHVGIAARVGRQGKEAFLSDFFRSANERLMEAGFIDGKDTAILQQRPTSKAAVDALEL